MSLNSEQAAFLRDVVKLFEFIWKSGYEITAGELYRTVEQQEIYVKTGRSKTMNSMHLKRCAIDLNFFKDGNLIQDRDSIKPIGDHWESLNEKNRWGGNWRGLVDSGKSQFVDIPHFERQV
jgi:hypothetical protein